MELANPDTLCINTIRTLSMDAVQAANSGHPGTPMAMAPVAYCLWQHFLRFDPQDPIWPNRDRFVLSAGHASMLLYSLLHLTGVKAVSKEYETLGELSVPLEEIKHFRQLDSRCPGHPEYRWTSGVECTTGPLGRAWPPASAWRSPADGWRPTSTSRASRTVRFQRLCPVRRRLHDGRHLGRGRLAGRASGTSQPLLDLRQQPHHHRRATPRWPSARTWPRASSATAGTSPASATPTTWTCWHGPSVPSRARPIGRRSSSSTATSPTGPRTSRTPARPTASPSGKRKSA